jgi:hypothetical protein
MPYRLVSDPDDVGIQYQDSDNPDKIHTIVRTDEIRKGIYEAQKFDGWTPDHRMRRIARIDLNLVKFLAKVKKDVDCYDFLMHGDRAAMMRMINRYPEFFKACYGGI